MTERVDPHQRTSSPAPVVPGGPIRMGGFGSGWGLRAGMALCLGLLALYGVLWGNTVQATGGPEAYVRRTDFRAALTAALIVAEGHGAQLYTLAAQDEAETRLVRGYDAPGQILYAGPPWWAVLLAPLVRMGLAAQFVFTIWTLISAAAAGLSLGLLAAGWPTGRAASWLLMLGATSFFPLITSLMVGQSTALALLGLAAATTALKYRRDGLAGVALALVLVQPGVVPLLLLGLLLARRWRALVGFAVGAAVLVALLVPVLGWDWPLQYLAFALEPTHWAGGVGPTGELPQSWRGLFAGLAGLTVAGPIFMAGLSVALLAWVWTRRAAGDGGLGWDRAWALTMLLALPGDPLLGPAGLALALVPGWVLAAGVAEAQPPRRGWAVLLALGYVLTTPILTLFAALPPYAPLAWLVGLVGVLAVAVGRDRPASEEAGA